MSIIRPLPLPTTSQPSTEVNPLPEHLGIAKHHLIKWRLVGGVLASMLVIGWIFIIVILIQEEKWQLVLVAWLLLYAAAHFCYWYFKRHHLLSIHSMICRRDRGNVGVVGSTLSLKSSDAPPSYDDIVKSEGPPPEYYTVVEEIPKVVNPRKSPFTFPNVFGRSSAPCTPCPNRRSTSRKPIFYIGNGKLPSVVSSCRFSRSHTEVPSRKRSKPPPYFEFEGQSINAPSTSAELPSRMPVVASEPILSNVFNNINVAGNEHCNNPKLSISIDVLDKESSESLRKYSSD